MVKGVSRQVIVVRPPGTKLFEQAKPRLGASRRRRHRPRLAALRSLKQNHRSRPVVLLIAIMR